MKNYILSLSLLVSIALEPFAVCLLVLVSKYCNVQSQQQTLFYAVRAAAVAMQRRGKNASTTIGEVFSVRSVLRLYKKSELELGVTERKKPCGGGVEYLHRDPASRNRRPNGKSQIWDSKIWSRVPRDFDPRKTALARANSIYKRQTRPLVREGAPQNHDRNCQTVINIWSWAPDGARHQDLLTDRQSQCDFDSDLTWLD
jgi:hypothetical protein